MVQIEKLSPVKIIYRRSIDCCGLYDATNKYITIEATIVGAEKAVVLLHEIGHAIHDAKNCRCMAMEDRSNHTLGEYHALRFVMNYIKGNQEQIQIFIQGIIRELRRGDIAHRTAVRRIMKLKAYKKL